MLLVGRQKGHAACKKYGGVGGGHWLVRMEWRPAGWSVCLPLLIFPCTIKSRSSLLAPAHPGGPGKRAVKRLWCSGGSANKRYFYAEIVVTLRLALREIHLKLASSVLNLPCYNCVNDVTGICVSVFDIRKLSCCQR